MLRVTSCGWPRISPSSASIVHCTSVSDNEFTLVHHASPTVISMQLVSVPNPEPCMAIWVSVVPLRGCMLVMVADRHGVKIMEKMSVFVGVGSVTEHPETAPQIGVVKEPRKSK